VRPLVKWWARVEKLREIPIAIDCAFHEAQDGVPGPVYLELPVDLLFPEASVREMYGLGKPSAAGFASRFRRRSIERHVSRILAPEGAERPLPQRENAAPGALPRRDVSRAAALLRGARRPVMVAGSPVAADPAGIPDVVRSVVDLGIPTFLSGMARGLLGRRHPLEIRHERRKALREADLVVLAGVPCDFRLDYGRSIAQGAAVVSAHGDRAMLHWNRRAKIGVHAAPGSFLPALAKATGPAPAREDWLRTLRARDEERESAIASMAMAPAPPVNPIALLRELDGALADESVVVADGGDFVATASYVVRPRRPLSWLDPGPFGTLGAGAGFALGAKLCRPEADVWLLLGDGAAAYGLMEVDTLARHGVPAIALVGNDAAWAQIARVQLAVYGDGVATSLARSDYHLVADALGGRGMLLDDAAKAPAILREARDIARAGTPVVINAHIGSTEFRKGSLAL
jgi:acetolactate synthase-1/2/3 large subunit